MFTDIIQTNFLCALRYFFRRSTFKKQFHSFFQIIFSFLNVQALAGNIQSRTLKTHKYRLLW